MTIDARLEAALCNTLGPDAAESAMAGLIDLEVCDAQSLVGIERCRALESLGLMNCELNGLSELRDLPALNTLTVTDCRVGTLDALAGMPRLGAIELVNVDVADIAPLTRVARLFSVEMRGLPLSDAAGSVREALTAGDTPAGVTVFVEIDPEPLWALNRRLQERGWRAGFVDARSHALLRRRGLRTRPHGIDWVELSAADLSSVLEDSSADLESTFRRFARRN